MYKKEPIDRRNVLKFSILPEHHLNLSGGELKAESGEPCGTHVKKKENDGEEEEDRTTKKGRDEVVVALEQMMMERPW